MKHVENKTLDMVFVVMAFVLTFIAKGMVEHLNIINMNNIMINVTVVFAIYVAINYGIQFAVKKFSLK